MSSRVCAREVSTRLTGASSLAGFNRRQVLETIFGPLRPGAPGGAHVPTVDELTALPFFASAVNNFNKEVLASPTVRARAQMGRRKGPGRPI